MGHMGILIFIWAGTCHTIFHRGFMVWAATSGVWAVAFLCPHNVCSSVSLIAVLMGVRCSTQLFDLHFPQWNAMPNMASLLADTCTLSCRGIYIWVLWLFGIQFFWGWEPPVLILFPGSSKFASLQLWSVYPLPCGKCRQIGRDVSRMTSHGGLHASVVCSLKHAKIGAGRAHQLGRALLDYRMMLVQLCNWFQKIHLQIMH